MAVNLKKISDQVIVLTGASSGIGLATARMAAQRGARLVLAARGTDALSSLQNELQSQGCDAVCVTCDVGNEHEVERVARTAKERFGGFDTWINDAGISVYGRIEEISTADMRRVIDTNFWGVVYGSRTAVRHLKQRGGALINVGSEVSDRAIPMQGIYSASKHAVKGFTDALRMELEEENAPISVTLIKPASINTPFTEHAKNYMEREPELPPPVYAPDIVAEAILHCAENPERDMFVGGASKLLSTMGRYMPRLTDKYMESSMIEGQKKHQPARSRDENSLYRPGNDLRERGVRESSTRETSYYTKAAMMNPMWPGVVAAAGIFAVASIWKARQNA